ncbi:uncharacterized protein KGF55_005704 [Candida pseudojiufengensis]|uniref:uncharacterized protein n=1 Tax=Candida pseudojiufengensis TaxID=497109 RepID=UPI0022257834|nr:uncharacterized protein KGF55_005704 [Candida pseudojiufengensis]KAI5958706.1 hypothetical protein KGF55_005704 [Candida pseudojiufengensis]
MFQRSLCFKNYKLLVRSNSIRSYSNLTINNVKRQIPPPPKKSKFFKKLIITTTAIGITGGTIYIIDKEYNSSLITRSIRALYVLLWIAYEYGYNSKNYKDLNELHEIASEKLLQMLTLNKGLYIKLGQAIANQGNLFPKAFQEKFPKLYDEAPFDSWDKMNKILEKNLGQDYETKYFDWIDHKPIASASIAQVHKAKFNSNFGSKEIALKIQHDYIEKQVVVDLLIYKFINKIYEKVFDVPLSMFSNYVSEQLNKETNFINEMENAEKLTKFIENDSTLKNLNIKIPENYPELTTRQVLPAEWINGISLTDKNKLIKNGFDLKQLMNQYIILFGRQIFNYGFVHSDPHPGNLLVKFDDKGKQQLVLLDHGLYITLNEQFKLQYCQLWKDLFILNIKGIERIGKQWGINSTSIFATIVLLKPIKPNKTDESTEKSDVSDLLKDLIGDKSKFPMELPFLARTMRMIQNINQQFGSPVNRINLLTNQAINEIYSNDKKLSISGIIEIYRIKFSMLFSGIIFGIIRFSQWIRGDSKQSKGLEDYIEMYMQNTAKNLGIDWS